MEQSKKNFRGINITYDCKLHLDVSKVSTEKKTLRQLAIMASKFGGQGFQRCNCKQGCKTNKCKCKSNGLKCNSKCHSSLSCINK